MKGPHQFVDFRGLSRDGAPFIAAFLRSQGIPVRENTGRVTIGKKRDSGRINFHPLYVYTDTGKFIDHSTGRSGDLIELICYVLGRSKREAIKIACVLAGRDSPYEHR